MVMNLSAVQETQVQSLGQEERLEKGKATHSTILAWRIPWTEEPGKLQSMGVTKSQTRLSDCHFHFTEFSRSLQEHSGCTGLGQPWFQFSTDGNLQCLGGSSRPGCPYLTMTEHFHASFSSCPTPTVHQPCWPSDPNLPCSESLHLPFLLACYSHSSSQV